MVVPISGNRGWPNLADLVEALDAQAAIIAQQADLIATQAAKLVAQDATIAAQDARIAVATPIGTYTVETLPTPNAARLLRVADVTNLFGNRTARVRCEKVAGTNGAADLYFWQPMSSDSSSSIPIAASMSLIPLLTPTTIDLTGAIGANITRTVTLATTGGWPGCVKEFRSDLTYGLGGVLNIAGTGLGSAVSLILGGYRKFVLEWTGSALAWRQIV